MSVAGPASGGRGQERVGAMPLPRISIVVPSFNQAAYLDEALRSVLDQGYPDLELIVIDGGSTDGSAEIIRRYADRLAYWCGEPDGGHYQGLNKGFARATGQVLAWLNSDDKHTPWTLSLVGEVFASLPEVEWLTTLFPLYWDAAGRPVRCHAVPGFRRRAFYRGYHLPGQSWPAGDWIQQESTFWRRSLWERAGGRLDPAFRLAGDFDLWARFFESAELCGLAAPLAGFRLHGEQKTAHQMKRYVEEARAVLGRYGRGPYGRAEGWLRVRLPEALPGRLARRLREPSPVCVHGGREGGWRVERR